MMIKKKGRKKEKGKKIIMRWINQNFFYVYSFSFEAIYMLE